MRSKLVFFAAILAGFLFTGCDKEDPNEVNVNTRATISGWVRGNVDLSNDYRIEQVEVAPGEFENDTIPEITLENIEGVRIFGRYNTSALTTVSDPNYTYEDRIVEAVTDASGRYELAVPAGAKVVMVAVSGTELEINQVLPDGGLNRRIYTTANQTVSVTQNVTRIVDFIYFAN